MFVVRGGRQGFWQDKVSSLLLQVDSQDVDFFGFFCRRFQGLFIYRDGGILWQVRFGLVGILVFCRVEVCFCLFIFCICRCCVECINIYLFFISFMKNVELVCDSCLQGRDYGLERFYSINVGQRRFEFGNVGS